MGRLRTAITGALLGSALYASSLFGQTPSITKLNCGVCYWESVIQQNPMNRKEGAMIGLNGILVTTEDEWKTTKQTSLDGITENSAPRYWCDPEMTTLDGKLIIAGMVYDTGKPSTGALWMSRTAMTGPFEQKLLVPQDAPNPSMVLVDAPKVTADDDPVSPFFGNLYVAANAVWFPERNILQTGIFSLQKGTIDKEYGPDVGVDQPPQSVAVLDGNLYLARNEEFYTGNKIVISRSTDGGKTFSTTKVPVDNGFCFARVATGSNMPWLLYPGAALATDQMHHKLYLAYAQPRACEAEPNITNGFAMDSSDIFLRSSDDGLTWSDPVQMNADIPGDRGFPSITVDTDGALYGTWIVHDRSPDQPIYDVHFTRSRDGKNFESDVRVNDLPIPNSNNIGHSIVQSGRTIFGTGRDPGDYLNMVTIGDNYVFVLHPCASAIGLVAPDDACVARIPKYEKRRAVRH